MNDELLNDTISVTDPIQKVILKYKNHPSIMKIKEKHGLGDKFLFHHVSLVDIETEIRLLNNSKACPKDTIPANIIKDNIDILSYKFLHDYIKM